MLLMLPLTLMISLLLGSTPTCLTYQTPKITALRVVSLSQQTTLAGLFLVMGP
jgi:hypothetical protein